MDRDRPSQTEVSENSTNGYPVDCSEEPDQALVERVRQLEEQIARLKGSARADRSAPGSLAASRSSRELDCRPGKAGHESGHEKPARKKHAGPASLGSSRPIKLSEALRSFIDSNVIPIHISDIHGRIFELNDATVNLLGYKREELVDERFNWMDITPPEYHDTDENAIRQIKETGRAPVWEKEYVHKDGHRVPVLIGVSALDRRGEQCLVYTIDLSERKKVEAELRASEAKFRLLAEAIPQMVWITDEKGRRIYCNERLIKLTGLDPESDDGFQWMSLIHPDDRQTYIEKAQQTAREVTTFEREARFKHADGSYRWQLVRGVPIHMEPYTSPLWFGTWTDIDDQKRLADELLKRELRFRTLIDAIPQIVFSSDANGELEFFNFRWFEYTGLDEEQSRNGAWRLLIHQDDLPRYLSGWNRALGTGDSYEVEFRLKRAVGVKDPYKRDSGNGYRWHLARAVALRGHDGEILTWLGTWTEIESQRRKRT